MISLSTMRQSLAKKRDQDGFTIVELLIVIVVIGILAALVVTTYAGIQSKARDSKRQTDIQAVQTQVEAYYASSGYYPALVDINSTSWRATNMKSLDPGALTDPSGSTAALSGTAASSSNQKVYGYVATDSSKSNAVCTTADATCDTYQLSAWLESSKTVYTKNNLD